MPVAVAALGSGRTRRRCLPPPPMFLSEATSYQDHALPVRRKIGSKSTAFFNTCRSGRSGRTSGSPAAGRGCRSLRCQSSSGRTATTPPDRARSSTRAGRAVDEPLALALAIWRSAPHCGSWSMDCAESCSSTKSIRVLRMTVPRSSRRHPVGRDNNFRGRRRHVPPSVGHCELYLQTSAGRARLLD